MKIRVLSITFLVWQLLTIFGTWMYHHETMCRVHSWSRFENDLWPQDQIYRFLSCLRVRSITSDCFDTDVPNLANRSITLREWVARVHNPDVSLTFDLKVKFIGLMTWLCVRATVLCPSTYSYYVWHVSVSPWYDVSRTFITSVWLWPLTPISNVYFQFEFESDKIVFALWQRHCKFWHMGV